MAIMTRTAVLATLVVVATASIEARFVSRPQKKNLGDYIQLVFQNLEAAQANYTFPDGHHYTSLGTIHWSDADYRFEEPQSVHNETHISIYFNSLLKADYNITNEHGAIVTQGKLKFISNVNATFGYQFDATAGQINLGMCDVVFLHQKATFSGEPSPDPSFAKYMEFNIENVFNVVARMVIYITANQFNNLPPNGSVVIA